MLSLTLAFKIGTKSNTKKQTEKGRKHCEKNLPAFSPFSTMLTKGFFLGGHRCLVKGEEIILFLYFFLDVNMVWNGNHLACETLCGLIGV